MVKKTDFNSKVTEIEVKIPNVSGFLLTSVFNSKITEVENKTPDIKNLASKTEVTAIENKIPDVNGFVKKTDYAAEINKIKNVTTTALDARHKDLVQKTYFDAELKKDDDKVGKNSSDILSYESRAKQKEDTLHDLQRYTPYLRGKNYFDGSDGTQSYLVFQGVYKYFLRILMFQKLLFNFMLIHVYQKEYLTKKLVLLLDLNVHL